MTPARLAQIAHYYNTAFPQYPDSHLIASDRWLRGVWTLGNDYRNLSPLYGSYPPAYLRRIFAMFPKPGRVLHLFSGSLPPTVGGVRLDMVDRGEPGIVQGDAHQLPFLPGTFDLSAADPPYTATDADRYGTTMVNRRLVLQQVAAVTKPGGILVWLDTVMPMFAKRDWHWFGTIMVVRSINHRFRGVLLFERT